jgi:hypothetical protein
MVNLKTLESGLKLAKNDKTKTKRPSDPIGGPFWLKVCAAVKDDLRNELYVETLACADSGSAEEVASRVTQLKNEF